MHATILPSIGNDVVDVEHARNHHPRFAERIASEREQDYIAQHPESLWVHWAAKEAGYKALSRLDPKRIFSPVQFEYFYEKQELHAHGSVFPCTVREGSGFVHVICATSSDMLGNDLISWCELAPQGISLSDAVRKCGQKIIADRLGVSGEQVQISTTDRQKSDRKIPKLFLAGIESGALISLSHHGRWVAGAVVLLSQAVR